MENKIDVVIVDDHSLMREGLCKILQMDDHIHVIKAFPSGQSLLDYLENGKADIILLDINMADINGIETLRKIKKQYPDIKVIMLTVHDEKEYLIETLNLGADGYILKDSESDTLVRAIETVFGGGSYVHPSLAGSLFMELNRQKQKKNMPSGVEVLTRREHEVLLLIAEGTSNRGISERLNISEKTVKNHVSSILRKLNFQDRTQAAIFAIKKNLM